MALQGYKTTVRLTGSATILTSEGTSTYSTAAHTRQINTASKRVLSSTAALTIKSGSYTLLASDILSVNYLFGAITLTTAFTGSTHSQSIKVSGKYLPTAVLTGAHTYSLSQSATLLDNTDYSSTGWTSRVQGLKDVTLTVDKFEDMDLSIYNTITAGTPLIIEIRPGGTGNAVRGWFLADSETLSGAVNALEANNLKFSLDTQVGTGAIAWGAP